MNLHALSSQKNASNNSTIANHELDWTHIISAPIWPCKSIFIKLIGILDSLSTTTKVHTYIISGGIKILIQQDKMKKLKEAKIIIKKKRVRKLCHWNVNFSKNCAKFQLKVNTFILLLFFFPSKSQTTTLIHLATTMINITQNIDWSTPAFYFQTGNQLMSHCPKNWYECSNGSYNCQRTQ